MAQTVWSSPKRTEPGTEEAKPTAHDEKSPPPPQSPNARPGGRLIDVFQGDEVLLAASRAPKKETKNIPPPSDVWGPFS